MQDVQGRVEHALDRSLPSKSIAPEHLHEAMRYAVLGGGKRVRPLLVFAAGQLGQAPAERLDRAACAVELIHAYSLVHDDLPCMDDDVLRRGKPTVHVEFSEACALLVGDALHSLAFQLLADGQLNDQPARQLAMVAMLASAAGSRGMAGGQAIDLAAVGKALTRAELEFMHIHKTGALIRASVMLGLDCGREAGAAERDRLDHFAKIIGLLFQVVDDVLDSESNTATLGKTAGKDQAQNKPTYVSLLGPVRAREFAAELHREAKAALAPFGAAALRLNELTDFILARQF